MEIGRAIGAEYITQGTIGKFGNKLTISVELYESMSGKLLSSIVFESKDIDGLLGTIRSEAKPLFQGILDLHLASKAGGVTKPEANAKPAGGIGVPQWIGIGLAAAGIGMGVYGFLQNGKYKDFHKEYGDAQTAEDSDAKWRKMEDAKSSRNLGYIIGSALLAGGITVWVVF
ncbi:hypothetical protein R83H12_01853 [Fibrobacteria bacterium R8-3-H12]